MSSHRTSEREPSEDGDLASRRALFELSDDDLRLLGSLRPLAERQAGAVVDAFYGFLFEHAAARRVLRDEATIERLKVTHAEVEVRRHNDSLVRHSDTQPVLDVRPVADTVEEGEEVASLLTASMRSCSESVWRLS